MSKNLDDELARAAGIDDDGASEASDNASMAVPQPAEAEAEAAERQRGDTPRTGRGLLVMLLLMVVGIVCLFMFGFKEAAIYSMPLDDFLAKGEELVDRRVRIEGELVPGTLVKRDKPCEYRFSMRPLKKDEARSAEAKEQKLKVTFPQCVIPDTFRDVPEGGVLVTAEGQRDAEGNFEATHIMAKCSSKYDPETHLLEGSDGQAKNDPVGDTKPALAK
jgi:cytochrome c-type biogenesis protein CcmE